MSDRPWIWNWFLAIIGAAVIGVSLPAVLVSANNGAESVIQRITIPDPEDKARTLSTMDRVWETIGLIVLALIFCGPLTLLLGWALFGVARGEARSGRNLSQVIQTSLWMGVFLSMFNLPAWLVVSLIPASGGELIIKTLLLFGVAGSSAGAWIAWQAWRTEFPGTAWLPPFSLKALMLVVLSWGGLLAVFTGW